MALSVAQRIARLDPNETAAVLATLSDAEVEALERDWLFWARPEQLPPGSPGWWLWVVLAGRGFGKTRTGAEFVLGRAEDFHRRRVRKHRVALIARTAADCRDTMVEGESGLAECAERRQIRLRYEPSKRRVTLPDLGTRMTTYSAEEPESLRGPQFHTLWGDEPASWAHKVDPQGNTAWTNAQFGLRLDPDPRAVLTGTPKPIPMVKALVADAQDDTSGVVLTQGSLRDNIANLAPQFVRVILAQYGGTLLGAQEIDGLLIDRVIGALWQPEEIERWRLTDPALVPDLDMIVVGVDPPAEDVAECGIIVVGREANPKDPLRRHIYVLEDASMRGTAEEWGRAVIDTYHRFHANKVVGEVNNGGDMVRAVVHLQDPTVAFVKVRATDGKRRRAEPVQMLYQGDQGRAHHVGYFGALEAQMTTWTGTKGEPSPDRLDGFVWGATGLLPGLGTAPARSSSPAGARMPGRAGASARQPR